MDKLDAVTQEELLRLNKELRAAFADLHKGIDELIAILTTERISLNHTTFDIGVPLSRRLLVDPFPVGPTGEHFIEPRDRWRRIPYYGW